MKTSFLPKVWGLCIALGIVSSGQASVTITLTGGILYDSGGTPLSDGQLIQLIASPGDAVFSAPTETAFVGGDDLLLASFAVNSATTGTAGSILTNLAINYGDFPTLVAGAKLLLRWYDIPLAATQPGANASYGEFRTDSIVDTANFGWLMPADGPAISIKLNFVTVSVGGSQLESAGLASLAAIPEPATYGMLAGLLVIGTTFIRRRIV